MLLHGRSLRPVNISIVLLLVLISFSSNVHYSNGSDKVSASGFTISGWTFPWDEPTIDSIYDWVDIIDEVSPYWYWININGTITATHNETEDVALITYLHQKGIDLIPMISNNHDPQVIMEISRNMSFQSKHIEDITNLIRSFSYQGIDINYENIPTSEKDGYANFIMNLSQSLHSIGKDLYVSVFPKVSDDEDREGPGGYDYSKIGLYADRVRIMAYNLHWSTAPTSGPITSIEWMDDIISYASTVIPSHRIQLGAPQFGYDWVVNRDGKRLEIAENVSFPEIMEVQKMYDVERKWNSTSRTPYIEYREKSGKRHHIHYSDAESIMHQMKLIGDQNLAGISIWKLGGEDRDTNVYLRSLQSSGLDDMPPFIDLDFDSITAMRGQEITFKNARVYDLESAIREIYWDFGNGDGSDLIEPSYTYQKGGFYIATIKVEDTGGQITERSVDVRIGPYSSFLLEEGPNEDYNITLNATASWDPEGILSYTWDMGDGTYLFHSMPIIDHQFEKPGEYIINLTIINEKGYTDIASYLLNIRDTNPPLANAGSDIITYEGQKVTLDSRLSSDDSGYYQSLWIVEGHGNFSGDVISFIPHGPGVYEVELIVFDNSDNFDQDTSIIDVKDDTPPRIELDYPEWVPLGQTIMINGSGCIDNVGILNYTWDLGNGNMLYGMKSITIQAHEARAYYCTLHLYDKEGNWNSTTIEVEVKDIEDPFGSFKIDPTPRNLSDTYASEEVDPSIKDDLYGVVLANHTYIFSASNSSDDSGVGFIDWWFGDGNKASGPIVYHEYMMPGLYQASFSLIDIWGNRYDSNFTLLVIPSWNISINEINNMIDEFINNTIYVEPEIVEDEEEPVTIPLLLFIFIVFIVILSIYEVFVIFSYQRSTIKDILKRKQEVYDIV